LGDISPYPGRNIKATSPEEEGGAVLRGGGLNNKVSRSISEKSIGSGLNPHLRINYSQDVDGGGGGLKRKKKKLDIEAQGAVQ